MTHNKKIRKTAKDRMDDVLLEMATILCDAGQIDEATLREYEIKIPTVKRLRAIEIKRIRKKINVSQPVFARLLNISPETIKKWEQGERKPTGASLKLLNLVATHGLEALY